MLSEPSAFVGWEEGNPIHSYQQNYTSSCNILFFFFSFWFFLLLYFFFLYPFLDLLPLFFFFLNIIPLSFLFTELIMDIHAD